MRSIRQKKRLAANKSFFEKIMLCCKQSETQNPGRDMSSEVTINE